jgi:hypothetical protein
MFTGQPNKSAHIRHYAGYQSLDIARRWSADGASQSVMTGHASGGPMTVASVNTVLNTVRY